MLKTDKFAVAEMPLPAGSVTLEMWQATFIQSFSFLAKQAFDNASSKGFWAEGPQRNQFEQMSLVHAEVSEAVEGLREQTPLMDKKVPQFTNVECELADAIVRIADFSHAYGLNVAGALVAKMNYNLSRPFMHNKIA